MHAVEVVGLRKSYGRVQALRGLTFRVSRGEIYGLLGPNGAGKTTTLKILVGLLRPDSGTARIMGVDVVRDRVRALSMVGYIPENPVCFQNLTLREFLEFVTALRGLDGRDVSEPMRAYLSAFDLEEKQDELMGSLSRGMVQKALAIAAFLVRPKVLIMDEPMAGMDPEAQRTFKEEVRRLCSEGAAAVMSSHILDTVERFCTRVGIIDRGTLVAEGDVGELKKMAGPGGTLEDVFLRLVREDEEGPDGGQVPA